MFEGSPTLVGGLAVIVVPGLGAIVCTALLLAWLSVFSVFLRLTFDELSSSLSTTVVLLESRSTAATLQFDNII